MALVLFLAGALASCQGSGEPYGRFEGVAPSPCPFAGTGPPAPIVHLGPDVNVRSVCGNGIVVAVASLFAVEGGAFRWRASLGTESGPFTLETTRGTTCPNGIVDVVRVTLNPPHDAAPGDAFDATVSFAAEDEAFPPGVVKVHVGIAALPFQAPDVIEFGDVPVGSPVRREIIFRYPVTSPVWVRTTAEPDAPFGLEYPQPTTFGGVASYWALLDASLAGDFSSQATFQVVNQPEGRAPTCASPKTILLHGHVGD